MIVNLALAESIRQAIISSGATTSVPAVLYCCGVARYVPADLVWHTIYAIASRRHDKIAE